MLSVISERDYIRETSDCLVEYLQSIQGSDDWSSNWVVVPGHPDEPTGRGERQVRVWVKYLRTSDKQTGQGNLIATCSDGGKLYGNYYTVEFQIGAKAGDESGWWLEVMRVEGALRYIFEGSGGPPTTLTELGFVDFDVVPEEERDPTVERPETERAWILSFRVPAVTKVGGA